MKPGWQHVKEAITTDQKNLTDDDHIHEMEKRELKLGNRQDEALIPQKKPRKPTRGKK
jgi:hypothetical protein